MQRIAPLPQPALEVRDLRLVLALAQSGTTGRAAGLLGLTQPAVSRALVGLEERLGARLFARTPRGLTATSSGERLLAAAAQLLASLSELERQVRAPAAAPLRVRIVCECYTAYHWLPSALRALEQGQPALDISLAIEHTNAPLRALEAGEIDAALLTTARVRHPALIEAPLFSDEVAFVLSPRHPLAKRRVLTPSDLRAANLITAQAPVGEARWFMRAVFGRARPRLSLRYLPLTEAVLDLARAGDGIAVLSEWMASAHLGAGDLVVRRLASGPLLRPWRIAWRKELGAIGERLRDAIAACAPRARLVG